jgi:hypothetical protein
VALDWVTFIRPVAGINVTAWNPQAALGVALLIWRPGAAWLVLLGVLAGELLVRGMPADVMTPLVAASIITLTSCVIAHLLRRALHASQVVARPRDFLRFATVALLGSFAAGWGYVLAHTSDLPDSAVSISTIVDYWIGDTGALLLTLPALLVALNASRRGELRAVFLSAGGWASLLTLLAALVLLFHVVDVFDVRLAWLLLPILALAGVRLGFSGAACICLLTQVGVVIGTQGSGASDVTVFALHALLTLGGTLALFVGIGVDQRRACGATH